MREAGESLIYIKPKHAWKRLKAADEENVTAYVYGISGSGKNGIYHTLSWQKKIPCVSGGAGHGKRLKTCGVRTAEDHSDR